MARAALMSSSVGSIRTSASRFVVLKRWLGNSIPGNDNNNKTVNYDPLESALRSSMVSLNDTVLDNEPHLTSSATAMTTMAAFPTYHQFSSGGYVGQLSKAFNSPDPIERIKEILVNMKRHGYQPTSSITFNYLMAAHLRERNFKAAWSLLKQMEEKSLKPDLFTFELWLQALSRESTFCITIDELFQLMKVRYEIEPSSLCWSARLKAWMGKSGKNGHSNTNGSNDRRVIALFEQMRSTPSAKGANSQALISDADLYYSVIRMALKRSCWRVAAHVLSCTTPTVDLQQAGESEVLLEHVTPTNPPVRLSTYHYYNGFLQLNHGTGLSLRQVPFIRYALGQLRNVILDEGMYVKLLLMASNIGDSVADIAYYTFCKLKQLYKERDGAEQLPLSYLQAYCEAIRKKSIVGDSDGQGPDQPLKGLLCSQAQIVHIELADKLGELIGNKK